MDETTIKKEAEDAGSPGRTSPAATAKKATASPSGSKKKDGARKEAKASTGKNPEGKTTPAGDEVPAPSCARTRTRAKAAKPQETEPPKGKVAPPGKPATEREIQREDGDGWKTVSKKNKKRAKGVPQSLARAEKPGEVSTEAIPGPRKRPLDLIRDEASAAVKELRTFCLRPESKVTKESGARILGHTDTLYELVQELLLRNSFLEGQLASVCREVSDTRKATVESVVQRTLKAACRPDAKSAMRTSEKRVASTYADAVKVDSRRVSPDAVMPPRNMVRIFPPKGKSQSSDATKQTVLQLVKPAKAKIRVKAVRRIHSGGIVVETERAEDLLAFTKSDKLKGVGLSVSLPAKRNPTLIVYDVPKSMTREEVSSSIWKQNLSEIAHADASSALKVRFATGPKEKKETTNWVLEVSPLVRQRLKNNGARVYIGWSSCRVQDFVSVTRCFKCQMFGHMAKFCKAKEEVCGHCATNGHTVVSCGSLKKPPVCTNCKARDLKCDHRSRDKACASYKEALKQVVARTNYG